MKPQKTTLPVLLVRILIGLVLLYGLALALQMAYFLFKQAEAIPKLDALNEAAFTELPPPAGVAADSKVITGFNENKAYHGTDLSIYYPMGEMLPKQVLSYYDDLLLSKGWQVYAIEERASRYEFIRGTACLDLHIYYQVDDAEYNIVIWHDFWAQPFSPPQPNLTLLNMLESGQTRFSECTSSSRY